MTIKCSESNDRYRHANSNCSTRHDMLECIYKREMAQEDFLAEATFHLRHEGWADDVHGVTLHKNYIFHTVKLWFIWYESGERALQNKSKVASIFWKSRKSGGWAEEIKLDAFNMHNYSKATPRTSVWSPPQFLHLCSFSARIRQLEQQKL